MTALDPARSTPTGGARELERADQQAILDNIPALIAYWDRDLRNRLANKAYVDFFGKTPDDLFGCHISEMLGPDLYRQNLPYLERALAGERQEFDREIPTPSGPRYTQAVYLPDIQDDDVRGIFVLVTDISARRRAEVALANAEARFRVLFEAAPSATVMTDRPGRIVSANRAAARLFGYEEGELEGLVIADIVEPEDLASSIEIREQLLSGELPHFSEERRYRHRLGHTFWAQAEVTMVPGTTPDDDAPYLLTQLQDTTLRKRHEHELEYLAHHDALTGVLNRRGLASALERQTAAAGDRGCAGAVLVCDVDRFKAVNDALGHEVGDELLVHIGRILEQAVRSTDIVGRLGGDEFAVLLPNEGIAGARAVAAKIEQRFRDEATGRRWASLPVGLSIGVAQFTSEQTVDEVLGEADREMYAAKAARRTPSRAHRPAGEAERRRPGFPG